MGRGPMKVQSTRNLDELDWEGVDVVLECTGAFNDGEKAKAHLERGARKVLISAPAKNVDKTIVYGVNHRGLAANDNMISNGSCTTNCLAPLAKVLDEAIGIERGIMTTIHAYTGDQATHDTRHSDLYRARAAAMSMIPTSTGAAKALGEVLPQLKGKLDGSAIRVPTPNVSAVDLTFEAARDVTVEEVNAAVEAASKTEMGRVLSYDPEPKVSIDFNHTEHSSIFAPDQTRCGCCHGYTGLTSGLPVYCDVAAGLINFSSAFFVSEPPSMTNSVALGLGAFILGAMVIDVAFFGAENLIFLGKKFLELIEWLAFWR